MKLQEYIYMRECNKNGIRIYPILRHGYYYLVIERNKSEEFHPREVIGKPKEGEQRYDPNKEEWHVKILELYEHLYHSQVMPKSKTA